MNKQLEETMSKIQTILEKAVYLVESKEIYAHGIPEARLMPPNFEEDCEERFLEWANEEVKDVVNSYLESVVYTNG